jgi:hypothetical protein
MLAYVRIVTMSLTPRLCIFRIEFASPVAEKISCNPLVMMCG